MSRPDHEQYKQDGDGPENQTDRRTVLRTGLLAGIGLVAGAVFHGLSRASAAQEKAAPTGVGPTRPGVGELGQCGVGGYQGRDGEGKPSGRLRKAVPSSCLQCVAICGILGFNQDGHIVKIEGNPYSPNNRGMVCAKSQAGLNQVYDPDRLLYPLVRVGKRGEGKWKRISMKEALDLAAFGGVIAGRKVEGLKAIYESDKPEQFMFHYGRSRIGGAVTQFVNNAFGSKTVGNHTSICETAKWLGNELTMGKHYDVNDVEHSKCILIFGANVLESHTSHSYFAQRLIDAKAAGAKIITFDVRLSNTAACSSEWVPIRPGTDLAVILAMTNIVLNDASLHDAAFIEKWSNVSLDELKRHYSRYTPEWAEKESGVSASTIRRVALEYGRNKPSTIVTYRGYVGHYNGAYAEWACKALDAISGNFNVKGGTNVKVSGKAKDAYLDGVARKNPRDVRTPRALKLVDGEGLHLPTHHSCQWIYEMIAKGSAGRPRLYMLYCYNGAYTTGDCERNIEVLCNEAYLPFIVSVDVAMSETTACADLVIPDATYLERWTLETPQSYARLPFLQVRQPVAAPLGEAMDMQDVFIQLARRIGGGMARLHPYANAEAYTKARIELQAAANEKEGKTFYDVNGKPLLTDAWDYLREYGILLQSTTPAYHAHEKKLKQAEIAGKVVDEKSGVIWDPGKAHVTDDDVKTKGYTGSKNAYKGYVGQVIGGAAYKGFPPDKLNKSGRFEIRSEFMRPAAEAVLADIRIALRPDEDWVSEHLKSGLPCWVPVPEHRKRGPDQLVMTSFKVNVQIHSRSQNCKWLQEIYHKNPAWINPGTARRLLGPDVKEGDLVKVKIRMPALPVGGGTTKAHEITARLHLTEGIHPEAIAISYHCGHWAYGRYASGKPLNPELTGAKPDGEFIWWQKGKKAPLDPKNWSEIAGVHPNWIIPNLPARVSGQFRSNDTVVSISKA